MAAKRKAANMGRPKSKVRAKVVVNSKPKGFTAVLQRKRTAFLVVLAFVVVGVATLLWARAATATYSLWSSGDVPKTLSDSDAQSVELGVKFKSAYSGSVLGVRFYKGPLNTGTHTGSLWTAGGRKLASVTFTNETASGWQTAYFAQPVNISASTNYVVSYFAPQGHYSVNQDYFTAARNSGPLTAPRKGNGLFTYASKSSFPKSTYKASNYWVDVVFNTSRFIPTPAPQPPTNLQAVVAGGTSVKLTWTPSISTGVTGYEILRNGTVVATGVADSTFTDEGLTAGSTYKYQVRAVDQGGSSAWSNEVTVSIPLEPTVPPTTPPPPPPPPTSGACPNPKHTPGGPDGMGGCWPYEGNTGVPAGTVLEAYNGPCTLTTPVTIGEVRVVDGKEVRYGKKINCDLRIQAKGVTIMNSEVNGAIIVDGDFCSNYSFKVSDSRIHTNDINLRGLMSCSFTATRVNVSGGQSMAWCDTCTIEDSYLHHPLEDPAGAAANHGAHNSTVRISKYAILKHNTLWCFVKEYSQPNGEDTSGCSANQTGYSHDGAPPYNSRIEANLYMPTSGGYCAYGGSTIGDTDMVHDIVFVNNVFKRDAFNGQGGPKCGYWGAITSFDSSRPGNKWINNTWDDGTVLTP